LSHRLALVLAVTFTLKPLIGAASGLGLHPSEFWTALAFWFLVVYQWRERARRAEAPAAAEAGPDGRAGRVIGSFQDRYAEAPAGYRALYWVVVAAGAAGVYLSLR
jgi:hypothetical protein